MTVQAFNLAERFRCPVFLASNKEIAMTRESLDVAALHIPDIINRTAPPAGKPFLPFQVGEDQCVPDFLPIGCNVPVRQTSSTHGENGYITTNQQEIARILLRLKTKLESAVDTYSFYELLNGGKSDTLIIVYGVTARAAKSVFKELKSSRKPVHLLILKTLWPVSEDVIRRAAKNVKRVVVVEMNLGQYVQEIKRILADKKVDFCGQMDGGLISPDKIKEAVTNG
jgi:2-oxoglutarate ferredoxin oxidoreductase subunit alpha